MMIDYKYFQRRKSFRDWEKINMIRSLDLLSKYIKNPTFFRYILAVQEVMTMVFILIQDQK